MAMSGTDKEVIKMQTSSLPYTHHHLIPGPELGPDPDPFPGPGASVTPISVGSKLLKPPVPTRYRECLKNHAANIGGNVTDGCGEFMPSGPDGTLEALKCAACNCHRNFHRKETLLQLPPKPIFNQQPNWGSSFSAQPVKMVAESSSDELVHGVAGRKRFRTKFSQEQKEKMLEFAEKVGWRIPREDDPELQSFCSEVGVKRQVLKVWMHNNKAISGKKQAQDSNEIID